MSQAVTVIFAEYFGLDQQVDRNGIAGLLADRVALLEQEIVSLKHLVETRLQSLDGLLTQEASGLSTDRDSGLPSDTPEVVDVVVQNSVAPARLSSSSPDQLPDKLPNEESNSLENGSGGLQLTLLNEPLNEPLNESREIKPIPGIKLSKLRFGLSESMIAGKKRDKPLNEFTQWTKEKDPDGIAWKYVLTPSKGYLPVDELPSELKTKLLKWMAERDLV